MDAGEVMFPALVLSPKTVIPHWVSEIEKHSTFLGVPVQGTSARRVQCLGEKGDIYVVNYDAVRSPPVYEALSRMTFKTVIADESTLLKEARTQRWKLLQKLLKDVPHKAILTGKPIVEAPEEIFAQALFLDGGEMLGSSFWKFRWAYFMPPPPWKPYDWVLRPGSHEAIAERLKANCILIPKEVILKELPPKVYETIELEMPKATRKMYEELRKDFQATLPSGIEFQTMWAMVRSQKLHQLCQGVFYKETGGYECIDSVKLDWLRENIPFLIKEGPVLVWTHLLACVERIATMMSDTGFPYATYQGSMSDEEKHAKERLFQEGKIRVLVLSEGSGYMGLDLPQATTAIFFSTDYKAGWRENAEDRCHRIGSEIHSKVVYIDLCMKSSIDSVVLKAIKSKQDVAEMILRHIKDFT
jgi:SNF2 family DNA or RNA helicase